ncbi:MAG: hypothetical protein JWM61_1373 [Micrococcaceae bacterium]|jgi:hypothetical protein|nr:hypothetical protein [Micrococcaceae bacterium]
MNGRRARFGGAGFHSGVRPAVRRRTECPRRPRSVFLCLVTRPARAVLGCLLLGVPVHRDETELRPVAEHPFVVVEGRPGDVAADIRAVREAGRNAVHRGPEIVHAVLRPPWRGRSPRPSGWSPRLPGPAPGRSAVDGAAVGLDAHEVVVAGRLEEAFVDAPAHLIGRATTSSDGPDVRVRQGSARGKLRAVSLDGCGRGAVCCRPERHQALVEASDANRSRQPRTAPISRFPVTAVAAPGNSGPHR